MIRNFHLNNFYHLFWIFEPKVLNCLWLKKASNGVNFVNAFFWCWYILWIWRQNSKIGDKGCFNQYFLTSLVFSWTLKESILKLWKKIFLNLFCSTWLPFGGICVPTPISNGWLQSLEASDIMLTGKNCKAHLRFLNHNIIVIWY